MVCGRTVLGQHLFGSLFTDFGTVASVLRFYSAGFSPWASISVSLDFCSRFRRLKRVYNWSNFICIETKEKFAMK